MAQYYSPYQPTNMRFETPRDFLNSVLGHGYMEHPSLGNQCQAFFRYFQQQAFGRSFPAPGNGGARNNWLVAATRQALIGLGFTPVSLENLQFGDWVFLSTPNPWGHVAMFVDATGSTYRLLGQNQGGRNGVVNVISMPKNSFLGALRPNFWNKPKVEHVKTELKNPAGAVDAVINGFYGNGDERVLKLRAAGYDPEAVQKLVNERLLKPAPQPSSPSSPSFSVGDKVFPIAMIDYNGTPLTAYDSAYEIIELQGDRAVLSARGVIWAAVDTKNLKKL